jgi:hypothetical protein
MSSRHDAIIKLVKWLCSPHSRQYADRVESRAIGRRVFGVVVLALTLAVAGGPPRHLSSAGTVVAERGGEAGCRCR